MALAGFAYSCMVVSSFSRAQQKVLDMGYPNDMNTSTMISGTFKIYLETFSINFLKPRTSIFTVQLHNGISDRLLIFQPNTEQL